ncbi:MAG: hypothetical protein IPG39_18255 [Bacteroidetes bacterium]|nr:hypothetical protein [Bacteroidota bacterium]
MMVTGHSFNGPQPVGPNDIYYLNLDVNEVFAGQPLTPIYNYGLAGNIYYDQNQNGTHDSGDFGMSNYPVSVAPVGQSTLTNPQGNYLYNLPINSYTVNINTTPDWTITSDSSSYSVSITSGIIDSLDFGLFPAQVTYDLESEIIGVEPVFLTELFGLLWILSLVLIHLSLLILLQVPILLFGIIQDYCPLNNVLFGFPVTALA